MKRMQILTIALLLLLGIVNNAKLLAEHLRPEKPLEDLISAEEEKFLELREFLPHHAMVGYLGRKHVPGTDGVRSFRMVQYFLAPVVVVNQDSEEILVTYLEEEEMPGVPVENKWTLTRDFGRDVKVYRRRSE